jgi:hypothetical protein
LVIGNLMLVNLESNPSPRGKEPGRGGRDISLCVCVTKTLLIREGVVIRLRRNQKGLIGADETWVPLVFLKPDLKTRRN